MPIGKVCRRAAARAISGRAAVNRAGGDGGAVIKPGGQGSYGPFANVVNPRPARIMNMTRYGPPRAFGSN